MRKQNGSKKLAMVLGLVLSFFLTAGMAHAFQPEAKVVFTFDDSRLNGAPVAFPIMEKYGFPGVCYVVTGFIGEDWTMSWDRIKEFQDEGWEIGSHTRSHPSLIAVTDQQLVDELLGSRQDLEAQGINVSSMASPYGDYDARVLSVAAKYYKSHRTAWPVSGNAWPYNDYLIMVREVTNLTTPEEVGGWIDEAISGGQLLVLLFHALVDGVAEPYQYNVGDFERLVEIVAKKDIEVTTISEALRVTDAWNLVKNFSFRKLDEDGWAKNWGRNFPEFVSIDRSGFGNFPEPTNSLKVVGGTNPDGAWIDPPIFVKRRTEYLVKTFQNVHDLSAGGWGILFEEYDRHWNYLGIQWLGGNYANFFGIRYYTYTPSSSAVKWAYLVPFTLEGSKLTLFMDSVEVRGIKQGPCHCH